MKKKYIVLSLLAFGVILLCVSTVLAIIATGNKNIIGGADLPTFLFVFSNENGGLYSKLAFWGVTAIIAAIIGMVIKKK